MYGRMRSKVLKNVFLVIIIYTVTFEKNVT